MLSRLIITFLCAAAIGSVSGAFLTFDPEYIIVEDIEETISFSAKLNSKPTEEVTVYFENPLMPMSTWSSDLPGPLAFNSPLLAKAVTAGSLPAELSNTDTLEFIRGDAYPNRCSIKKDKVSTFDEIYFLFSKPGCGPVKSISEYSPTYVTSSTNGLRYAPGPYSNDHIFYFPYGSRLDVIVIDDGGIMSLDVDEDVLTNSGARTLNLPVQQPGTVCTFPVSS
ncbi:hypothetical protein BASA62_002610 [Batrachochytrium salamandrivorans]|nr:hypothetical protein BASA62_002610 [Batrachochytrium salamandrivorans]